MSVEHVHRNKDEKTTDSVDRLENGTQFCVNTRDRQTSVFKLFEYYYFENILKHYKKKKYF